jgi:hypothetical protein
LIDPTHASIQAETFSPFIMFGNGTLALQVNSTGFDIVGGTAGITGSPNISGYTVAFPGAQADGFGKFDLTIDSTDGPNDGTAFLAFSLVNNAGTWANVSSVLAANGSGYDAAMQIAICEDSGECGGAGFAAEPFTSGHIVPQPAPEPGMLSLLGIGLLAMGSRVLRRRKA